MLSKSYTKYIQSLHHKKFRDEEGAFIAEGNKVVLELLASGRFICEQLMGLPGWLHENRSVITQYYTGTLFEVKEFELQKISALSKANQVLAVFKKGATDPVIVKDRIILALDTIQDPGNFGTIIRIADWFGVDAIICSNDTADMYNPKVVQSSMGSLGRVNITYTSLVDWMKDTSIKNIYAAVLNGKSITILREIKEAIIIIGNESNGISEALMQLVKEKITIPRIGHAESLNAAVATGIILSHIRIQP